VEAQTSARFPRFSLFADIPEFRLLSLFPAILDEPSRDSSKALYSF
jgi:hypothetical protein